MHLAHVLPFHPSLHECRAEPADHGEAGGEGNAAHGNRGDEWLAIALQGVREDPDRDACDTK
jgi:hypothetical protein